MSLIGCCLRILSPLPFKISLLSVNMINLHVCNYLTINWRQWWVITRLYNTFIENTCRHFWFTQTMKIQEHSPDHWTQTWLTIRYKSQRLRTQKIPTNHLTLYVDDTEMLKAEGSSLRMTKTSHHWPRIFTARKTILPLRSQQLFASKY